MRRSPLHDFFVSRGATFTIRDQWEVPEAFSGRSEEYRAATDALILSDRTYRGLVRITGRDRVNFLHNMLTNDVRSLKPGAGLRAALLSRKGKLIADLVVYRREDSILLDMEPERVERFTQELSHYIVSEDVRVEDATDHRVLLGIDGPRARDYLSSLADQPVPPLPLHHFMQNVFDGVPVRLSAVRHGPGAGFELAVPNEAAVGIVSRLVSSGESVGLRLAGTRTLEILRIEAGIPRFGVDMDESHLLLETGLDDAVSFDKGCYVGQEYVARLAHRGHLNRKLVGLKLEGKAVPSPGDDIIGGGRYIGQLTSIADSPRVGPIALGYVQRDFLEPATQVSIRHDGADLPACVHRLPFIEIRGDPAS